jgi:hypothetical protein
VDNHLDDDVGNGMQPLRDGHVNRFGYFFTAHESNDSS